MIGTISGLYVGTKGAKQYRETCGENCKDCPYENDGKCRIDEHEKKLKSQN